MLLWFLKCWPFITPTSRHMYAKSRVNHSRYHNGKILTMFNERYKTAYNWTSISGKTSRQVSYRKPRGILSGACHSWPRALNCLLNKVGMWWEAVMGINGVAVVRRKICGNAWRERPVRVEVWADRKSILDQSLDWAYCMLNSFLSTPHDLSSSHVLAFCLSYVCGQNEDVWHIRNQTAGLVLGSARVVIIVWGKWRQTPSLSLAHFPLLSFWDGLYWAW